MKINSSTLPHAFLQAADEFPQATAIIGGAGRISYRDLAQAAKKVRRALAASAFCVLLDPGCPRSRRDFMAPDSCTRVICADPDAGLESVTVRIPVTGDLADTMVELFTGVANSVFDFTTEDVWTLCHSHSLDFSVGEMRVDDDAGQRKDRQKHRSGDSYRQETP